MYSIYRRYSSLKGIIIFKINLNSKGKVKKIVTKENETGSDELVKKIVQVIKLFQFGEGKEFSFSFPIQLL